MSKARRTAAAITGAAALGVGLGVAGFASAAPSPSPSPTSSASASPSGSPTEASDHLHGGRGEGGRFGDRDGLAAALAEKLDLDQAKVATALQDYREANRPTTKPSPGTQPAAPDDAALAKALAKQLDVAESDVTKAITEIRAERTAARKQAVSDKLATAVKAGTLTQAEADAVQKAADAGIVHVGR